VTDVNYFATTSSTLGAIYIDVTARFTIVSGSYFGFDTSGNLVASPSGVWIDNNGVDSVIGVDHRTSSLSGAYMQSNVFAPASTMIRIAATANNTIISGNYFGYHINGSILATSNANPGDGVNDQGEDVVMIGTNEDGLGDYLESNWFGCVAYESLSLLASKARISGNYFGFREVNHTSPATSSTASCHTGERILVQGDVLILGQLSS